MAEAPLAVASAVILPESTEHAHSPPVSLKRRNSSSAAVDAKRARLNNDKSHDAQDTMTPPQPATQDRQSERRKSGQMEERKRGQRLFGALLGTLSQSSSSTAHKRRADIEEKQQAKLKLQAEEQDEQKKQNLENLMARRRRQQKKYDSHSMHIRHSNLLAHAHFLQTKVGPTLFYKPWELLPGDDDKIKAQIKEAEERVKRETTQWDADNPQTNGESSDVKEMKASEINDVDADATTNADRMDTVGSEIDKGEPPELNLSNDANGDIPVMSDVQEAPQQLEAKDQGDDGGEVVEGEEDTVIY